MLHPLQARLSYCVKCSSNYLVSLSVSSGAWCVDCYVPDTCNICNPNQSDVNYVKYTFRLPGDVVRHFVLNKFMLAPKPISMSLHDQVGAFLREKCKTFGLYEYALCEFLPTILENQTVRLPTKTSLKIITNNEDVWLRKKDLFKPYSGREITFTTPKLLREASKYQTIIDAVCLSMSTFTYLLYGTVISLDFEGDTMMMSSQLYQHYEEMMVSTENISESPVMNSEVIITPAEPKQNVKIVDQTEIDIRNTLPTNYENRAVTEDCAYTQVGPLFYDSHHFKINHKNNVLEAIAKRTAINFELDHHSNEYLKFKACYNYIITNVFTDKNISLTFHEMMTNDSSFLMNHKPKKMSAEEYFERIAQNFEKPLSSDVCFESFLKLESIHKLKAPRIIINEGPNTVVGQLLVALIYEHILFAWLPANNIKRLTRDQFAFQLSARHSQTNRRIIDKQTNQEYGNKYRCLLEIDQTSFDMSESSKDHNGVKVGLLTGEFDLFDKISGKLFDCIETSISARSVTWRRNTPSKLVFHTKSGMIKAKLDRRVRHSGDRMTSSGNFLIEFISTMVAIFDDPVRVLEDIPRYSIHKYHDFWYGTRREILQYNGFTGKTQGCMSLVSPIIEGDDGMVGIESCDKIDEDTILRRYNKLGLDAKVALVSNGAVNFCGINFMVEDGRTQNNVFAPDIIRAISKIGIARKTLTKRDIYSANLVRAAEFAGKQDWLARIYKTIADAHICDGITLSKEDNMKYGNVDEKGVLMTYQKYYNTPLGLSVDKQGKLLIASIKDGIKSKYKNFDRLDEVVDFLLSHSSIDWVNMPNPKTLLPPIIREELEPYLYTKTVKCYNSDVTTIYYRVATCTDSWEWTSSHPKRQIPLVPKAKCKKCGDAKLYRNLTVQELANKRKKTDLRYICITCGHVDRDYDHFWFFE